MLELLMQGAVIAALSIGLTGLGIGFLWICVSLMYRLEKKRHNLAAKMVGVFCAWVFLSVFAMMGLMR